MQRISATFSDPDYARQAIAALERHGIEGASIDFSGPAADEDHTEEETHQADQEAASHVGRRIFIGALVGGVVGLGVGLAFFQSLFLILSTAATLGVLGGVVGGVAGLGMSPAWERSFQPDHQPAVVTVSSEDPEVIDRAHEVLAGREPTDLRRL